MGRGCRCLDIIERVLSGDYHPVYRRLVADANLLNGRWKAYEAGKIKLSEMNS